MMYGNESIDAIEFLLIRPVASFNFPIFFGASNFSFAVAYS